MPISRQTKMPGESNARNAPNGAAAFARYLVLVAIAAPLIGVAVYFVGMLKTAEAREVAAACNSLLPAGSSKTIGSFPTTAADFALEKFDRAEFDAALAAGKPYVGEQVSLSAYRGKVVLVNFWASWCKTCRSEKPSLETLAAELRPKGVEVLALASDPEWSKVRNALPKETSLTVLLDKTAGEGGGFGEIAKSYGIKAVPETFVVDKMGVIRHYLINKRDWRSSVAMTCIEALARE